MTFKKYSPTFKKRVDAFSNHFIQEEENFEKLEEENFEKLEESRVKLKQDQLLLENLHKRKLEIQNQLHQLHLWKQKIDKDENYMYEFRPTVLFYGPKEVVSAYINHMGCKEFQIVCGVKNNCMIFPNIHTYETSLPIYIENFFDVIVNFNTI